MGQPGWFPDPDGAHDKRYWDGSCWTEHVMDDDVPSSSPRPMMQPPQGDYVIKIAAPRPQTATQLQPPPPPPPPTGIASSQQGPGPGPREPVRVDNRFLVGIMALPVAANIAQMVLGGTDTVSWTLVGLAMFGNFMLAHLDLRANPAIAAARNEKPGVLKAAAVLLMPAYVWVRQRRLGASLGWFVGYLVAAVASVLLIGSAGGLNQIDDQILETKIEQWAASQFDAVVSVDCPSGVASRPGHEFLCTGQEAGAGPFTLKMRVLNRQGEVEWEVR